MNKRSLPPENVHLDTQNRAKKRQKAQGHVQNALDHTLHETSTSSDVPFSSHFTSSSQPSLATIASSPSKATTENVPHLPCMKQVQHSNGQSTQGKPEKLPQLPPIPDKNLEQAVFTHQSYLPGHNQNKITRSYDRLEFLGDAYIEMIASQLVYSLYPHMPAGRLSQQRENLVKNESLAAHSIAYGFDKRARLPPSVSNSTSPGSKNQQIDKKKQQTKTLGDIFEAYVAAIVLSNDTSGYQVAEEWLHKLWIPKLEAQSPAETRAPPPPNAKVELAKRIMGKGIRLEYKDTAPPDQSESSAGKTWYTMGAFLTGWGWSQAKLGEGRALNKNQAGNIAAAQALGNPLTEQISRVKREFDSKVAKERVAKEREVEQKGVTPGGEENSKAVRRAASKRDESEENEDGELSNSNDSDDSDDSDRP